MLVTFEVFRDDISTEVRSLSELNILLMLVAWDLSSPLRSAVVR